MISVPKQLDGRWRKWAWYCFR